MQIKYFRLGLRNQVISVWTTRITKDLRDKSRCLVNIPVTQAQQDDGPLDAEDGIAMGAAEYQRSHGRICGQFSPLELSNTI